MKKLILSFGLVAFWLNVQAQCTGLTPVTLPFSEGFESYSGEVMPVLADTTFNCSPSYKWEYHRGGNNGRLSFDAVSYRGSHAAVLDVDQNNAADTVQLTLTINMLSYTTSVNPILLRFLFKDNSDETHAADRVWLRGSSNDSWIEIANWNGLSKGSSSWIEFLVGMDTVLSNNSQSFSSTTQIRWGQYDNYPFTGGDGLAIDDIQILEYTCPNPTNLAASNVTGSTIDLSWISGGASAYQVAIDTLGKGTPDIYNVTTGATYTVTGLEQGMTYEIFVRDSCGTGDVSFWEGPIQVTTACVGYAAPYLTNFELDKINDQPSCWDAYTTTSAGYAKVNISGTAPAGPNQLIMYNGYSNSADTLMAISPRFTDMQAGNKMVTFWARTSALETGLIVGTVSSPTATASFSPIDTVSFTSTASHKEVIIDLSTANGYNGTDEYVAIMHSMGSAYDYLYMDDFNYDVIPSCAKPVQLKARNITSSSVDISFNDRGQSSYEYIYGAPGFAQASGTVMSASSNPFSVSGLNSNTEYEVLVRSVCASGTTSWSNPVVFTTECTASQAPYFTDFESDQDESVPSCWSNYVVGSNAFVKVRDFGVANGGINSLQMFNSSSVTDDLYAISPRFSDLTAGDKQVRFYAKTTDVSTGVVVGTMASGTGVGAFNSMDTIMFTTANAYLELVVPITAANGYNGTDEYVVLKHLAGSTSDYIYVDDFNYEVQPPCVPTQFVDINVLGTTDAEVSLNWTPGEGIKFWVEIGTKGFTPGNGLSKVSTPDTFATLTGLVAVTNYDIYLYDSCASGVSPAVGPITVTTDCGVVVAPFKEDFESWAKDSLSYCWNEFSTSNYDWEIENGATVPSSTGPASGFGGAGNYLSTNGYAGYPGDTARIATARIDISNLTGGAEVAFYYHMFGTNIGTMFIEINDGVNTYSGLGAIRGSQQFSEADPFKPFIFNMGALNLASDTIVVNVCVTKKASGYADVAIDEFEVRAATVCPTIIDFSFDGATATTADLSWVSGTNVSDVLWGPMNFMQASLASQSAQNVTSPYTITGLSPNTQYEAYVRGSCSLGAPWQGPVYFRTPCSSALAGGTYTIGGAGANFTSLDSLNSVLNECGIAGPVVFNFQPGHYKGQIFLKGVPGVSATNTITFNGGGSDTLTWDQQGPQAAVLIDSTSYVTLNNMYIVNDYGSENWGVMVTNHSDYVTIDGCTIVMDTKSNSGDISAIIVSNDYDNDLVFGAQVDYLTVTNSTLIGGYYTMAFHGNASNAPSVGYSITGNTISDFKNAGFYVTAMSDFEVSGNIIESSRSGADGIYLVYPSDFSIKANKIDVTDWGMNMNYANRGILVSSASEIVNNMVKSTGTYGGRLYIVENLNVFHNTFVGKTGLYMNDQDTVDIRNNIFVSTTSAAFQSLDSLMPHDVVDYNLYYGPATSGALLKVDGNNYADLNALNAVYTNFNQNSVEGNPFFVSNSDLHVMGLLANDKGDNTVGVASDIDGDVRPASGATVVDMGADEFTPFADDLELDAVYSPKSNDCGDSTMVVEVIVRNRGTSVQSGFNITAVISGSATASLSTTYQGSLAYMAADTIAVGTFNGISGGVVNVEAFTSLTNDMDFSNDTVSESVALRSGLAPAATAAIGEFCVSGGVDTLFFPAGSTSAYYWLTEIGDTLGTGDSLVVGPLGNNDTTFYLKEAGAIYNGVGAPDKSIGFATSYNYLNAGMKFTLHTPATIKTIHVYPAGAGDVYLNFYGDAFDTVVYTVPATAAGVKTAIPVNITLPAGSYTVNALGSTTGGFIRNSNGASYPYSVNGIVDITGNTSNLSGYYYYFYDWSIEVQGCPRPTGELTIEVEGTPTSAAFTQNVNASTATSVDVDFDASTTSADANSTYTWYFGDGNTGTGLMPTHTYTANGTYTVKLVVDGACGKDSVTQQVVVQGISLEENVLSRTMSIYPNPTKESVNVSFDTKDSESAKVMLLDVAGRIVMLNEYTNLNGKFEGVLNLSNLPKGTYILKVESGALSAQKRIVRM